MTYQPTVAENYECRICGDYIDSWEILVGSPEACPTICAACRKDAQENPRKAWRSTPLTGGTVLYERWTAQGWQVIPFDVYRAELATRDAPTDPPAPSQPVTDQLP